MKYSTRKTDARIQAPTRGESHLASEVRQLTAELNETKQALQEVKTQFEAIYDHHFQLTGLIDANGRLLKANKTALKLIGADRKDVIGKLFWETPWWTHSDDEQQRLREVMSQAMDGRKGHFETTHLSQTGEVRLIDFRICPVHDENGEVKWLVPEGIDITEQKKTEQCLKDALGNWKSATDATVQAISSAIESRDPYTAGHQKRVAKLAEAIARNLGLTDEEVTGIHYAGLVHDIGKISVPSEILNNPGILSEEAMCLVRLHSRVGHDILDRAKFPWPIARATLEHHERIDGSGYPQGLCGEQICKEARILAVADVVEAMATHRPYRPALGIEAALEEIQRGRGTKFDPSVVDACLAVIRAESFAFE